MTVATLRPDGTFRKTHALIKLSPDGKDMFWGRNHVLLGPNLGGLMLAKLPQDGPMLAKVRWVRLDGFRSGDFEWEREEAPELLPDIDAHASGESSSSFQ